MTEQEIKNLEMRLEYLAKEYRPIKECSEANYECDFIVDKSDECPCQWALKLNPDCLDIIEPKPTQPGEGEN